MGFFRILIWALLFYLIFKLIKSLARIFMSPRENSSDKNEFRKGKKPKSKIRKEDIIDAEFEEIKENEKENENSKN